MNTGNVILNSNIEFGTSGARGLVTEFSDEVVIAYVLNFIKLMEKNYSFSTIALGIDNRPSSYGIAKYCAIAIQKSGYKLAYYGVLPTPALALQGLSYKIPSIMVTGSHIPFDRNGLKFYRPDGEITKNDEYLIKKASFEMPTIPKDMGDILVSSSAKEGYIQRYLRLFPKNFLKNKHIGVYEHSSSGRDIYNLLFKKLGAKVTSLERSDIFVPIDTEAVSQEDRQKARIWSAKYSFDAIFSTDGDGDRPLVSDEKGEWLRGDVLGLLCAHAIGVEAIAIPVSCNSMIEESKLVPKVVRTRIGSPYVIEAFSPLLQEQATVAGFEANGGFLLASNIDFNSISLKALPTRDAVLPFLMLMYLSRNTPISSLIEKLPQRFSSSDRVTEFSKVKSGSFFAEFEHNPSAFISSILGEPVGIESVDETDGMKIKLDTGDFIHLRPSGNAPEFRCYVESATVERAEINLNKTIEFLHAYNRDN